MSSINTIKMVGGVPKEWGQGPGTRGPMDKKKEVEELTTALRCWASAVLKYRDAVVAIDSW